MSEQGINRRAPDSQSAMRHFEIKGGRFLGSQKNSQTVSFDEHARVRPDAHHAQSHETLWTSRQEERSERFSNRLMFSNRLTRLRPSHIRRLTLDTSTETYTLSRRGREPAPCPDTGARACPVPDTGVRVNRNVKTMLARHQPSDSNSPRKSHDHVITNTSNYDYIDAITSGGAG